MRSYPGVAVTYFRALSHYCCAPCIHWRSQHTYCCREAEGICSCICAEANQWSHNVGMLCDISHTTRSCPSSALHARCTWKRTDLQRQWTCHLWKELATILSYKATPCVPAAVPDPQFKNFCFLTGTEKSYIKTLTCTTVKIFLWNLQYFLFVKKM